MGAILLGLLFADKNQILFLIQRYNFMEIVKQLK